MNVLLNNYCNLKCSYCFANDVIDREKQSLSLADFRYVLKFHEKSSVHQLNIIGGEPTLHPKFNELLEMVAKADHIREVLIFTNGNVYPKQREAIANLARVKQVGMLINYNAPQLLPPGVEQRIHDCIKFLKDDVIFTLGINFFRENQEYQYLLDALKLYKLKFARWSLVVPNSIEKASTNVKDYFNRFKALICEFLRACEDEGIIPHVDCNNIPLCLLNDKELDDFAYSSILNLKSSVCQPVIDILPNLNAIRCFAINDYEVSIRDVENVQELYELFEKKVDQRYDGVPLFDECRNCMSFKVKGRSCACLSYKQPVELIS